MNGTNATSFVFLVILVVAIFHQTHTSCCFGIRKVCETILDVEEHGEEEWKSLIISPGRCENSSLPIERETLTQQTFVKVPKLTNLYIIEKIVDIQENAFEPLKNELISLSIIKNHAKEIPSGVFQDLPKLKRLVLRDNNISNITDGAFKNLPKLEILLLSGNSLREIKSGILNTAEAKSIDLSFNLISTIENDAFSDNLIVLNLKKNVLQDIPDGSFSNLGSLEMLILSKNKLKLIRKNTFKGLSNLSKLDLSRNEIGTIEPASFSDLHELMFLYLKYNQLLVISADVFQSDMINLTDLELDQNNLTFVSKDTLDRLPNLEEVSIGGNPWHCKCLNKLVEILNSRSVTISDTDERRTRCVENESDVCSEIN